MSLLMNLANNLINIMALLTEGVRIGKPSDFMENINDGAGGSTSSGSSGKLREVSDDINTILRTWVGPIMMCVGAVGAIYIIVLAVQYAKSESDSKRAEAKTRMINCLIGVIAIIALAGLCIGMDWGAVVKIFGYTSV